MLQENGSETDLARFRRVLAVLTTLTPDRLGCPGIPESYLDEFRKSVGPEVCSELLRDAMEVMAGLHMAWRAKLATLESAPETENLSHAVIRRCLVDGEKNLLPHCAEAQQRVSSVKALALTLARDVETMHAVVVVLTKLSPNTVRRTAMGSLELLALRDQHGPARAAELLSKVRKRLRVIESEARDALLEQEWRTTPGESPPPDMARLLSRTRSVREVVQPVKNTWRRVEAFAGLSGLLMGSAQDNEGMIALGCRVVERLKRSLSAEAATSLLDSLANRHERAKGKGLLGKLPSELVGTELEPVLGAARSTAGDIDAFLAMSVALTGVTRIELVQKALAESYLDQVIRAVGEQITAELLDRARLILQRGVENQEQLRSDLRLKLLGDQKLGPVARGVIKVWYLGQWEALPEWWRKQYAPQQPESPQVEVVSANAYKLGLAWDLAGAHPQAAHQPGFGSWALPPSED